MQQPVTPANGLILGGGVVMLIGSLLDFYEFGPLHANAWSGASGFGVFGIATVIVLCGVVMAAQVALTTFKSGIRLPDEVLGLTWDQVHLALGFQAAIMMFAFLLRAKFRYSFGIGFWLMLLAAAALLAGAIMRVTGAGAPRR